MSYELTSIHNRVVALLSDRDVRPTPEKVASLAIAGMTTQDIVTAGEAVGIEPPIMRDTLEEAATLIPYAQLAVDRVLAMDDDALVIAAMRDGEMFGDDGAIRYPGRVISLPASSHLFRDLDERIAAGDPMVEQFFAQHRMGKDQVVGRKIKLMDTGFRGSIALKLDASLQALYGTPSLIESGAMETYLICASNPARPDVHQILQPEDFAPEVQTGAALPKLARMFRENFVSSAEESPANAATAMQIMPRHTGHYAQLAERDGGVIAVDLGYADRYYRMSPQSNVDEAHGLSLNANVYNPVASLAVQCLVVSAVLDRV